MSLEDVLHPAKSTDVASSDVGNDIAVHDPSRGPFGSLYLALLGDLSTDDDDTLWWWDGTSKWHKTGLASKTTAAALAVAVEPGHIDTVYVGTAIGVFRATITFNGDTPSWPTWTRLDNGLPDVAVQDLAVFSQRPDPAAAGRHPGPRRLGARPRRTGDGPHVRAGPPGRHAADAADVAGRAVRAEDRRSRPTPRSQIDTTYRWHASPDLRVHPKLGPMAAPTSLPWTRAHPAGDRTADRFGSWRLWRFQTALRREDLRSEPTGVWDAEFDTVLRANGVPTPGGIATITKAYWESKVTGANLTRLPWDTPRPTEADLVEYLPAEIEPVRRPAAERARAPRRADLYVMLHHRGAAPAAQSDVQTTLLYRVVAGWQAKASAAWLPATVGWTAAIATLLKDGTHPAAARRLAPGRHRRPAPLAGRTTSRPGRRPSPRSTSTSSTVKDKRSSCSSPSCTRRTTTCR